MGCKECLGRYGVVLFGLMFSFGVLTTVASPSWISIIKNDLGDASKTLEINIGPFYSQNRTCTSGTSCSDWIQAPIDAQDCDWEIDTTNIRDTGEVMGDTSMSGKLCRHNTTWRVMAMICGYIVVINGILILLAFFTQCLTCGCCGGSFDYIAIFFYWIEVCCSIVAWSFTISTVYLYRDESDTQSSEYLWGFYLFILSGTICGAICAGLAGWAAEGSFLKCIGDTIKCIICCGRKD